MTIPEWCEKNQLSPHAYYYWRKIIRTHKEDPIVSQSTASGEIDQTEKVLVSSYGVTLIWKGVIFKGYRLIAVDGSDIRLPTGAYRFNRQNA